MVKESVMSEKSILGRTRGFEVGTHKGLCPTRRSCIVCLDRSVCSTNVATGSGGK